MGRRLDEPNQWGGTTDHSEEILLLRLHADMARVDRDFSLSLRLAADLLEAHDQTGISLDTWRVARAFVERAIGHSIITNGV